MIRLVIGMPTPSGNYILSMHPMARHRLKKVWARALLAVGVKDHPKATGKRRCTVIRHGERELDYDNLVTGAKSVIVDNVRQFGLLVDDKPAMADLQYRQEKAKRGETHTIVILEDIE